MKALAWLLGIALLISAAIVSEALAGIDLPFNDHLERILRGENPPQAIDFAEFRIGVFTYEDADKTGLGDTLSKLMAHHILANTHVLSLGVLNFMGGLAPSKPSEPSYFDKVEIVAMAQKVLLAVWGSVRRDGQDLLIDTYVQLPNPTVEQYLTSKIRFLGGTKEKWDLIARVRPDRIAVQRLRVPVASAGDFRMAAMRIKELRDEPNETARVKAVLKIGDLFYFKGRRGDWIKIAIQNGASGWVPLHAPCGNSCEPLLEAGSFVSSLVEYIDKRKPQKPGPTLTAEALAVWEQLDALQSLETTEGSVRAYKIARQWYGPERRTGKDPETGIDRGEGYPPGGAAFANIAALAKIRRSAQLDSSIIHEIAFELAEASQYDPRNSEVLLNLGVLFDYAGDASRAKLARSLADLHSVKPPPGIAPSSLPLAPPGFLD